MTHANVLLDDGSDATVISAELAAELSIKPQVISNKKLRVTSFAGAISEHACLNTSVVLGSTINGYSHTVDATVIPAPAGDLVPITITLRLDGKTTPRPGEVLKAILGHDDLHPRVIRSAFFAMRGEHRVAPLELEALRDKTPLQAAE